MSANSQPSIIARNTSVSAGIDKHITTTVTVAGAQYTAAQLKAIFQAQSTAFVTASASHKQWLADVAASKAASKTANALYVALHSYLVGLYGKAALTVLNDFGMSAPKSTPATSATKAAAAIKSKATRAARHTMGAVQKKAVTGDVTGVVVTPITSAPTSPPSATATPAPASPNPAPAPVTAGPHAS
jgi:hypothetical protein